MLAVISDGLSISQVAAKVVVSRHTVRQCLPKVFGSRQVPAVDGKIIARSP